MKPVNRKAHALQAEKTLAIPRHVIFFDTETTMKTLPDDSFEHRLKLGWTCYLRKSEGSRPEKQEWLNFTQADKFWSFVLAHCQAKNKLWVIAHQLSFDFTVVEGFHYLRKHGFKCRFFYSSGITTLIKVKKQGQSIMFVDSLNWFRESLDEIGERIGLPKMKVDFDTVDDSELSIYCRRDVEILVEIFKRLARYLESNRVSRLCYTLGSTAMAAYLFRHYRTKIYIHNNAEAVAMERASYKGGRTECFFLGELNHGPFYVLDINNLYSYVMRKHLYPVKYKKITSRFDCTDLEGALKLFSVTAQVLIETDEPVYAVHGERTIFPVGRFECTLTSPELQYAIKHNHLLSVKRVAMYEQANIFRTFVDKFYKLRHKFKRDDNPLFEHFTKLLLNSLYGKFGQKAERWRKIGDAPDEPDRTEDVIDAVTHQRKHLRYLLGEVFESDGYNEAMHSFPAIAAHVTAYARLYLWELMGKCGEGNYFYCDTDSLFVNAKGLRNLTEMLHDTNLGKLKIEYETPTLTIYGLKDYVTNAGKVIKGIRKNAVRLSDTVYRQDSWPTLRGILRDNDTTTYKTKKIEKHLSREYTKGTVTDSGWIVPFVVDGLVEPS